jgi:hypothetical protein
MPSTRRRTVLTERDHLLLAAVGLCPLTAAQLRLVSDTFAVPFASEHRLRQRLRRLAVAGLVRRHDYATTGPGALGYFLLTREGFRVLFGPDSPTSPGWFRPVSRSCETHAQMLGEILSHAVVCAHREGVALRNFHRENALALEAAGEVVRPDAAFELLTQNGHMLSFFVEADNRTEPVRAHAQRNSIERKLRQYEAWADASGRRFRLLFVTRGGAARVRHVLQMAAQTARNPARSLVYAATLEGFLARQDALSAPCFLDHHGRPVALLPGRPAASAPTGPAAE